MIYKFKVVEIKKTEKQTVAGRCVAKCIVQTNNAVGIHHPDSMLKTNLLIDLDKYAVGDVIEAQGTIVKSVMQQEDGTTKPFQWFLPE